FTIHVSQSEWSAASSTIVAQRAILKAPTYNLAMHKGPKLTHDATATISNPTPTSTPTTTQTQTAPVVASTNTPATSASGMCYNYGHQPLVNGSYDQTQVYGDLAELKASGVNCLRLAYYGYIYAPSVYASGDTNPQKLATMIQAWEVQNNWHFSLIIG